jgi:UDPglucose--hexose-1-phosphate uridylyltransferase
METEFLDPRRQFQRRRGSLETRFDPLTGQSARLLPEGSLPPPVQADVEAMAGQTRRDCPFCAERVETVTPRFPPEVVPEGRIRRGEALLFPNLVGYAKWSSVSVYSPSLHTLPIDEVTPRLLADNLAAQAAFAAAAVAHDPRSSWVSVNANQLPPSGSSIFHPHLQGAAHPHPTTMQRLLGAIDASRFREYADAERDTGERLIGSTGRIDWLASFAPIGPGEVRALVFDASTPERLEDELVSEIARGVSLVLRAYAELGYQSFNLALYGSPGSAGAPLVVRTVARATYGPLQRSDAMWSERLHWEAAVDLAPEALAAAARPLFARLDAP